MIFQNFITAIIVVVAITVGGQGHASRFGAKRRGLRLVYPGWDDAKVVQLDEVLSCGGKLARGGPTPAAGKQ